MNHAIGFRPEHGETSGEKPDWRWRRLCWLDIGVSHAGLPSMRLLAEAEQLSNLERLDLLFDFHEIKDEGVEVMISSPVLRNLGGSS